MITRRTLFKTIAALGATALIPPAVWLARKAETAPEISKDWRLKHKFWTDTRKRPLTPNETKRIISDCTYSAARQTADAEFRAFYNLKGANCAR